ncbi:hypothetical protein L0244_40105 [bacterium]|nr:hypothetical protein [bacterium]
MSAKYLLQTRYMVGVSTPTAYRGQYPMYSRWKTRSKHDSYDLAVDAMKINKEGLTQKRITRLGIVF